MFDFLIKSKLEVRNFGKLGPHCSQYLAKNISFMVAPDPNSNWESKKHLESKSEIINGSYNQVTLKEFVSSQNFESLIKQMENLLVIVKRSVDQFKSMTWNLEKFQKAKIKRQELNVLRNKFGSLVTSTTNYNDLIKRYQMYESMNSRFIES